jgi:hypothetical protein
MLETSILERIEQFDPLYRSARNAFRAARARVEWQSQSECQTRTPAYGDDTEFASACAALGVFLYSITL